nr:WGR domain-containing protein [Rhizobium sp. NXC14]
MNRCGSTDSQVSLDAKAGISDSSVMLAQPYQLYIERTDATKNMARFYVLAIEPTLFGTPCLTRRWGRIGTTGQAMVHHFDKEEDAVSMFLDLLRTKRARGYRPNTRIRREPMVWSCPGSLHNR